MLQALLRSVARKALRTGVIKVAVRKTAKGAALKRWLTYVQAKPVVERRVKSAIRRTVDLQNEYPVRHPKHLLK
jgi:hypothetical protein